MFKFLALLLFVHSSLSHPLSMEHNGDIISLIKDLGKKIGHLDSEMVNIRADMEDEKRKEIEYREVTANILRSQSVEISRLQKDFASLKTSERAEMKRMNAMISGLVKSVDGLQTGKCQGHMCTRMSTGSLLPLGQRLVSTNKQVRLEMQTDGNLVIYCRGKYLWQSGTGGVDIRDGLSFQFDGNLVLYRKDGKPVWNSGTGLTDANHLLLQDDGNLVLYGMMSGNVYWQAGTGGKCR